MNMVKFLSKLQVEAKPAQQVEMLLKKVEELYNVVLDERLRQVLQLGGTAHYSGKPAIRFMGLEEIVNAEAYLHVNFNEIGLLPLFDLYENDFICYSRLDEAYCVFNIIDHSRYYKEAALETVLTKLGFDL